jgi:hypothetical protein
MMDACGASFNAANSKLGPNIKILMCFFHVLKNVKEHLKGVDEKIKTEIVKDKLIIFLFTNHSNLERFHHTTSNLIKRNL